LAILEHIKKQGKSPSHLLSSKASSWLA